MTKRKKTETEKKLTSKKAFEEEGELLRPAIYRLLIKEDHLTADKIYKLALKLLEIRAVVPPQYSRRRRSVCKHHTAIYRFFQLTIHSKRSSIREYTGNDNLKC